MSDKYLFIFSHSAQITWYSVFAEAFKECGKEYKTVLFVHGKTEAEQAAVMKCYDKVCDVIDGFHFNPAITIDQLVLHEEILKLERDASVSFFWEDIKTDRWARAKNSPSFMIQYMNCAVSKVIDAFSRLTPVAALGEYTAALNRFAFRYFGSKGKPMIFPVGTRYYERLYFETTISWEWEKCMGLYNEYVHSGVPEGLKREIYPYYEKIILKHSRPRATIYQDNFPVGYTEINKLPIRVALNKAFRAVKPVDKEEKINNIRYSIIESSLTTKLKRIIRERLNHKTYQRVVSRELPPNIKYAVYFMHYQPEYTTDGLGTFYIDQQFLIKNIASSLPADMYLLVKEHPTMIGLRDRDVYRHILSNANVILINQNFDSVELIKEAQIVFTIVGTAALEAMFIGKPAIMFGRYAFAQTNLISLCTDIWQLGKMVREKINLAISAEDVRKHALALLAAKYKASRPGYIPLAPELIDAYMKDTENYSLVKESFRVELDELGLLS